MPRTSLTISESISGTSVSHIVTGRRTLRSFCFFCDKASMSSMVKTRCVPAVTNALSCEICSSAEGSPASFISSWMRPAMQTSGERSCAESAAKNFSRCNVVCWSTSTILPRSTTNASRLRSASLSAWVRSEECMSIEEQPHLVRKSTISYPISSAAGSMRLSQEKIQMVGIVTQPMSMTMRAELNAWRISFCSTEYDSIASSSILLM
mmetsp:Transcript_39673/g.93992  ORF Transcript_39673/g.93992 Transcript_39673/m.93992 type:complete len:208 (-) Transcript_39673:795-1418(-)